MKFRRILAVLLAGFVLFTRVTAQEGVRAEPSDPVMIELKALIDQITVKIKTVPPTAEILAPELARFDALLAKYAGQKTEPVANISLMKAILYLQVLKDDKAGRAQLLSLKNDFAGTKAGNSVDQILAQLDRKAATEAAKSALIGQAAPELNFNWSSREGLKTLSGLKGQVVVLDFWATWCGPCISSFPQIREHVAHFKGSPVTFLGVTSIQGTVANMGPRIDTKGDPVKEMSLMPEFMKAKEMTWDVVFSEQPVFNPAYGIAGIPFVAIIAPDGTVRHAGLHPGDPSSDITGKIEAILKEFKLPAPAKS